MIAEEKLNELFRTQKAVLEKVTIIEKSQQSFEARVESRLLKIEARLEILGEAPLRLANLEKFAGETETLKASVSKNVDELVTKSCTDRIALFKRIDELEKRFGGIILLSEGYKQM